MGQAGALWLQLRPFQVLMKKLLKVCTINQPLQEAETTAKLGANIDFPFIICSVMIHYKHLLSVHHPAHLTTAWCCFQYISADVHKEVKSFISRYYFPLSQHSHEMSTCILLRSICPMTSILLYHEYHLFYGTRKIIVAFTRALK